MSQLQRRLQLQLRFDLWPGKFHTLSVGKKKKKFQQIQHFGEERGVGQAYPVYIPLQTRGSFFYFGPSSAVCAALGQSSVSAHLFPYPCLRCRKLIRVPLMPSVTEPWDIYNCFKSS